MALSSVAKPLSVSVAVGILAVCVLFWLGLGDSSSTAQAGADMALLSALTDDKTEREDRPLRIGVSGDPRRFLGRWKVISRTMYGKESKASVGRIWEFKQDQRFLEGTLKGKYKIHGTETPLHIDIEGFGDRPDLGGGGPRKGIIAVKGDRLTLCVPGSAAVPRPKKMVSKVGQLNILTVMERVKEER